MMQLQTTTHPKTNSTVRAVHCDHRASDEDVYKALKRATDPLDRTWERLRRARRIAIKFNQDRLPEEVVTHQGHRQQLVSDPVARATVRLLRERTSAELFAVDIGLEGIHARLTDDSNAQLRHIFREFSLPYMDGSRTPTTWVEVPGGGFMFDRYPIPQPVADTDETVSVQKLKNHSFMGITLCLKNLFGLMAIEPAGRPRIYYHHLVRMPYMLADLGRIINPVLNIIDGLVGQAGSEWGRGEYPRICNTLLAGDHVVATDACGAILMGHDPRADWLVPPFHRDRNHLLTAAEGGFGSVNLEEIDWQSEVVAPVGEFFAVETDPRQIVASWLRTTAEQALYYRDHQAEFERTYNGKYILLQMGQVRSSNADGVVQASRRVISGDHPEQAIWMKYVQPHDPEGEHFEVYERTLSMINAMGL